MSQGHPIAGLAGAFVRGKGRPELAECLGRFAVLTRVVLHDPQLKQGVAGPRLAGVCRQRGEKAGGRFHIALLLQRPAQAKTALACQRTGRLTTQGVDVDFLRLLRVARSQSQLAQVGEHVLQQLVVRVFVAKSLQRVFRFRRRARQIRGLPRPIKRSLGVLVIRRHGQEPLELLPGLLVLPQLDQRLAPKERGLAGPLREIVAILGQEDFEFVGGQLPAFPRVVIGGDGKLVVGGPGADLTTPDGDDAVDAEKKTELSGGFVHPVRCRRESRA